MLLKKVRTLLTQKLWQTYKTYSPHACKLETALLQRGEHPVLDHYAIIDLPSMHSGMNTLATIFSHIGYCHQGQGYLPEKQNDFLWMTEDDAHNNEAHAVLPQAVLADFRPQELPLNIRKIIEKYSSYSQDHSLNLINQLTHQTKAGNELAATQLVEVLHNYLNQRDWPLPTQAEINTVSEANELLAWTLLFGRRPNHFTISAHLLSSFQSLEEFNQFVTDELKLTLNPHGGLIKGTDAQGIKQSSTLGRPTKIPVADGEVEVPEYFIEFVWRYPHNNDQSTQWNSYFTGFIANNANRVIESLYKEHF